MQGVAGTGPSSAADPQGPFRSPVFWAIVILCCVTELTLEAADAGLVGNRLWRGLAYQNGAFWPGLLYNWRPNYPLQPWLMFATYGFLHSGFWHLAGNMLTLVFLSDIVLRRSGQGGLALIYAVSTVGGAAAFGLLASSPQPMVGASGAIFGLAGAWQYWEWADRGRAGRRRWPVVRTVIGLALLNLVLWLGMGGTLAWQTHLGGFVAGWAAAALLPGRRAPARRG